MPNEYYRIGFGTSVAALAVVVVALGYPRRQGLIFAARNLFSLLMGALLLVCLWSPSWLTATSSAAMPWTATSEPVHGTFHVHASLDEVEISLKATDTDMGKLMDYEQDYYWGYGPNKAAAFQAELGKAQMEGAPLPVLWILEYLVHGMTDIDIAWRLKMAALYAKCLLWLSLGCWLIAQILFMRVVRYGSIVLCLGGIFCMGGALIYLAISKPSELKFYLYDCDLDLGPSWALWLSLINGLLMTGVAVVIILMDFIRPKELSDCFNIDLQKQENLMTTDALYDDVVRQKPAPNRMSLTQIRQRKIGTPAPTYQNWPAKPNEQSKLQSAARTLSQEPEYAELAELTPTGQENAAYSHYLGEQPSEAPTLPPKSPAATVAGLTQHLLAVPDQKSSGSTAAEPEDLGISFGGNSAQF